MAERAIWMHLALFIADLAVAALPARLKKNSLSSWYFPYSRE